MANVRLRIAILMLVALVCGLSLTSTTPREAAPPVYDEPVITRGPGGRIQLVSPTAWGASTTAGVRMSLSRRCPHVARPGNPGTFTATGLNTWMKQLTFPRWDAADVGFTVPLRDGRVMWLFGDTLRLHVPGSLISANSMWISDGRCAAQVLAASREVIPTGREGVALWPDAAFAVPTGDGDDVWVSGTRTRRISGGIFAIQVIGSTVAKFHVPSGGGPSLVGEWEVSADNDDEEQINWGVGMLRDWDTVYVYGSRAAARTTPRSAYVARVPLSTLTDRRSWEYWTGSEWSISEVSAAAIIPASVGVSQAFSVHKIEDRFVLVSKVGGDTGADVGVWTSPSPQGPWRLTQRVRRDFDDGSQFLTYQPLAHPDLPTPDGRLLVSLSRNAPDDPTLWAHPQEGRLTFIEVAGPG